MAQRIVSSVILILFFSTVIKAQTTESSEPIINYRFFNIDDVQRFFLPANVGEDAGDINGDGVIEYVQYSFSADRGTEELGDKIRRTSVCNYDGNNNEETCSIYEGDYLIPVGDLNGDGIDDMAIQNENGFRIYYFNQGNLDISTLKEFFTDVEINSFYDSTIPGFDVNGDGFEDFMYMNNEAFSNSTFCTIFGSENADDISGTCTELDSILGNVATRVVYGDLIGDISNELVILVSDENTFPYEYSITTCNYDQVQDFVCGEEYEVGTNDYPADQMRVFIGNYDGVNKDDIVFSHDRYTGFDRNSIFFQVPTTHIIQSNDSDAQKPITQTRVLRNNSTVEYTSRVTTGSASAVRLGLGVIIAICSSDDINEPDDYTDENYNGEEVCTDPTVIEPESSEDDVSFSSRPYSYSNLSEGRVAEDRVGFVNRSTNRMGTAKVENNQVDVSGGISSADRTLEVISNNNNSQEKKVRAEIITAAGFFATIFGVHDGDKLLNSDEFFENIKTAKIKDAEKMGVINDKIVSYGSKKSNNTNAPGKNSKVDIYDRTNAKAAFEEFFLIKTDSIETKDFQSYDAEKIYLNAKNISDINNDGFEDLMIGTTRSTFNDGFINKVWLFLGGDEFTSLPQVTFDFLSDLNLLSFENISAGEAMEGIGDVNGDGIGDFAIGLSTYNQTGEVFVYFGQDLTADSFTESTFSSPDLVLEPRLLNGQSIFYFGSQISAGDFDGDGIYDIAVLADNSFNGPAAPALQIFHGGNDIDNQPDDFLFVPKKYEDEVITEFENQHYYATMQFLPHEVDSSHQDIVFVPGPRSGNPDAFIYKGGMGRDSLPDITLTNPNRNIEFGFDDRTKPIVADFNEDGFYEILLTNQFENEDAFISSSLYLFSPNSEITISNEQFENPIAYSLSQNYPNPFNPTTNIEFTIPSSRNVSLKVFDILGREIVTLIENEYLSSGTHQVQFDAKSLASGIYFYRFETSNFTETRKMLLLK